MSAKYWLLGLLLTACCIPARAQRADGIYHIACLVQMNDAGDGNKTAECTTHPRLGTIGIGGRVALDVTTTQELMDEEGAPEITDLILFVDGQPLPGTHPIVESQTDEPLPSGASDGEENQGKDFVVTIRVSFPITRDLSSDKGKQSWRRILGGMDKQRREVPLSLGLINGPPLPSTYKAEFVRLGTGRLLLFLLVAAALGLGFIIVAVGTGTLRDKEPVKPGRRYCAGHSSLQSLAHANRDLDDVGGLRLPVHLVHHWGIQHRDTGIDSRHPWDLSRHVCHGGGRRQKQRKVRSHRIADRRPTPRSPYRSRWRRDASRQFGLWSVVLMIVFCVTTYETLAMPDFNTGLLGLMGISSAAYATMKIPEKKG